MVQQQIIYPLELNGVWGDLGRVMPPGERDGEEGNHAECHNDSVERRVANLDVFEINGLYSVIIREAYIFFLNHRFSPRWPTSMYLACIVRRYALPGRAGVTGLDNPAASCSGLQKVIMMV